MEMQFGLPHFEVNWLSVCVNESRNHGFSLLHADGVPGSKGLGLARHPMDSQECNQSHLFLSPQKKPDLQYT